MNLNHYKICRMAVDNELPRSFTIVRFPSIGFSVVDCSPDCAIGSELGLPKIQPAVVDGEVVPVCSAVRLFNDGSVPICLKEMEKRLS